MKTQARKTRKKIVGTVVSNKANKTITVQVVTKVKHPLYGKYMKRTTKIMAHDENNACSMKDQVVIMMTRPLSKQKSYRLVKILKIEKNHD